MYKFQKSGTKIDPSKDLSQSTRYEDQELIEADSEESRLDALTRKIDIEITLSSDYILKMERLQERYYVDCLVAEADNHIGYYMRYVEGYDRLSRLIAARYAPFRPILDNGKQNV